MAIARTTTQTLNIEPVRKKALRATAAREHRSIANMVGVLIRGYCERNDITIFEQQDLTLDTGSERYLRND